MAPRFIEGQGWVEEDEEFGPVASLSPQLAIGARFASAPNPTSSDPMEGFLMDTRMRQAERAEELASQLEQKRSLLDTQILQGYQRPKTSLAQTGLEAAIALAPSLIAHALVDSDKYGGVINKAGAQSLRDTFASSDSMIEDMMKARQQQAAVTANEVQDLMTQDRQLERDQFNNEYRIAQQAAMGQRFGQQFQGVSEADRAFLASQGLQVPEGVSYEGLKQGGTHGRHQDSLVERQRSNDRADAIALGLNKVLPKESTSKAVANTMVFMEQAEPVVRQLEMMGQNNVGWQTVQEQIPGTPEYMITNQLTALVVAARNANEPGIMTEQDFSTWKNILARRVYEPPPVTAAKIRNFLQASGLQADSILKVAGASGQNVAPLQDLFQNKVASSPSMQNTDTIFGGVGAASQGTQPKTINIKGKSFQVGQQVRLKDGRMVEVTEKGFKPL